MPLRILIVGTGIAGPSAAYWLTRAGHRCTIIERSSSPRKTGQAIDIRGPGVPLMKAMGIEEAVRAANTTELGIQKIGASGKVIATMGSSGDEQAQVLTSEFEILRADLARILVDKLNDLGKGVEVVYGETVTAIEERDSKVWATFANGRAREAYDLIVAADGMNSRTRSLVTKRPAKEDIVKTAGYVVYFSIPRQDHDSERFARLYNGTGGRTLLVRPTPKRDTLGVVMTVVNSRDERLEQVLSQGVNEQKALFNELFRNAGWEAERICDAMLAADDFYYQSAGQVRIDEWVYGRTVLVGDAAHAVSIMGTSAAMLDGYTLAGEITKHPDDLPAALRSYQRIIQPKVKKWQYEPEWVDKVTAPQTQMGVNLLNGLWMGLTGLRVDRVGSWVAGKVGGGEERLEEYEWVV